MLAPDVIPPALAVPVSLCAALAWLYLEWRAQRHGTD